MRISFQVHCWHHCKLRFHKKNVVLSSTNNKQWLWWLVSCVVVVSLVNSYLMLLFMIMLLSWLNSLRHSVQNCPDEGERLPLFKKACVYTKQGGQFRAQSFTSLKSDLHQDINGGFAFSRSLNRTFPWRTCSVKALVNYLRREDLCLLLFSFGLMY